MINFTFLLLNLQWKSRELLLIIFSHTLPIMDYLIRTNNSFRQFKAEKSLPDFEETSISSEITPKHANSEHETSLNHSTNSLENYSFTDLLLQASNDEIHEKVTVGTLWLHDKCNNVIHCYSFWQIFVTNKQKEFEEKDRELYQNTFLCEKIIAEEVRRKYLQTEAEEKEFEKI